MLWKAQNTVFQTKHYCFIRWLPWRPYNSTRRRACYRAHGKAWGSCIHCLPSPGKLLRLSYVHSLSTAYCQYFTLSGLSTDLGLLNNGITWGYTIGIVTLGTVIGYLPFPRWPHIYTAYIGKFGGCSIMARISGFQWREAATIGTLMSCKGCAKKPTIISILLTLSTSLIEIIVLNVGLAAGILDTVCLFPNKFKTLL